MHYNRSNLINRFSRFSRWFCFPLVIAAFVISSGLAAAQPLLSAYQRSPSLLPESSYDGPLLIGIAGAAKVNDADKLLPELLGVLEEARQIFAQSESDMLLAPFQVDGLIEQMQALDGRRATARGSVSVISSAPKLPAGWYLSGFAGGRLAGTFYYDPEDEERLRMASITAGLSGTDLGSEVRTAGVARSEIALHKSLSWDFLGGVRGGVSLKYQYVVLHERNIPFIEYEEESLFDLGRDTSEFHRANMDIGITKALQAWTFSAVLRDVVPYDLEGPLSGEFKMRPQINVAAQVDIGFGELSVDADLLERRGFSHVPDEREYGIDFKMPLIPKLELQAGLRHFDNGVDSVGASLGLNYRLQEYFVLGVKFESSGSREFGIGGQAQVFF